MSRRSVPCALHSNCSLQFPEVSPSNYSPSPNLSLISFNMACIASASSSPSVSMPMVAPLEAASIITPMMLFAFTRRWLRDSVTSHLKPEASCVSLAEARACRPSLLTISASCWSITAFRLDINNAFAAALDGDLRQLRQGLVGAAHHAQQHRQICARHAHHALGMAQPPRDVARRGAEDIRQDQHAVAAVELLDERLPFHQFLLRVVAGLHRQHLEVGRHFAQHMPDAIDQTVTQPVVGHQEDPGHSHSRSEEHTSEFQSPKDLV